MYIVFIIYIHGNIFRYHVEDAKVTIVTVPLQCSLVVPKIQGVRVSAHNRYEQLKLFLKTYISVYNMSLVD